MLAPKMERQAEVFYPWRWQRASAPSRHLAERRICSLENISRGEGLRGEEEEEERGSMEIQGRSKKGGKELHVVLERRVPFLKAKKEKTE